jgi:hypothetical protein
MAGPLGQPVIAVTGYLWSVVSLKELKLRVTCATIER